MKICVVKTSSMGDIIHTLPALTDAQNALPNLQVDWVVEPAFAEIPQWHFAVRQIIPFALRKWRKQWYSPKTWQQWQVYQQQLQQEQYDAVIDAQGLLKSAFFATRLANGTKYGYDYQSAREGLSTCFYNQRFAIPYHQHAVERIRQLFAKTLGYSLPDSIGDYGIAKKWQNLTACHCQPYVVAIHATTRTDKHWLAQHWITLFQQLAKQHLDIHLPWGNLAEKQCAEDLAAKCPNVKILPKMTLNELAQHIVNASAIISVDTGLSHLTAALDKPNIILYGATDPQRIGAYGKHQIYLQANGMANILPRDVLNAYNQQLKALC